MSTRSSDAARRFAELLKTARVKADAHRTAPRFGGLEAVVDEALLALWRVHARADVVFVESRIDAPLEYLPAEHAQREHAAMCEAAKHFVDLPWTDSVDDGVAAVFFDHGWIPVARDGRGGLVVVDLAPAHGGRRGQVVFVGRDPDVRMRLADTLDAWLSSIALDAIPSP